MKDDSRFVQLEIPGMEEFYTQHKTLPETTAMTLQAIKDISTNPDNQTTSHQLEIPGMEEFLAKLKPQSQTSTLSNCAESITISDRTFEDFAA